MPDTKVEAEAVELLTWDGDEYLYTVDDPLGTPTPSKTASRMMLAGADYWIRRNRSYGVHCVANNGAGTFVNIAAPTPAATGTGAGSNGYTTTNERTRRIRCNLGTGTTAGSSAGFRSGGAVFIRGGAAGRGGFRWQGTFAFMTIPATYRAFVGIAATGAVFPNADPSTVINMVGLGKDTGDAAWQVMSNDASGIATKTALNATNFPINDSTTVFEVELYCPPGNASNITYWIRRINGVDANGNDTYSFVATATLSTDLPAVDTVLNWHTWINNDVQTTTGVIDVMQIAYEAFGGFS